MTITGIPIADVLGLVVVTATATGVIVRFFGKKKCNANEKKIAVLDVKQTTQATKLDELKTTVDKNHDAQSKQIGKVFDRCDEIKTLLIQKPCRD